ncbi:hypothetical protein BDN72DRAFT_393273 [Pluteus cervinus]|uniref:Uncharacterized protein n=1 Tax=Pluteus cervinus TaxID=181527 RepID=A0ACD3A9G4_9AGAR|nr:hypothetical protein BDN72DRAFT_393273 [Pluteus cervinus]
MVDTRNSSPSSGAPLNTQACISALRWFIHTRNGVNDLKDFSLTTLQLAYQHNNGQVRPLLVHQSIPPRLLGHWDGARGRSSWKYFPGILCSNHGPHFHFVRLPGKSRGVEMKTWQLNLGDEFGDSGPMTAGQTISYHIDVNQDLLVLAHELGRVHVKLYFLSLTTGQRHSLSHSRELTISFEGTNIDQDQAPVFEPEFLYLIESYGHILAVSTLRNGRSSQLAIFNWKTGDIFAVSSLPKTYRV